MNYLYQSIVGHATVQSKTVLDPHQSVVSLEQIIK